MLTNIDFKHIYSTGLKDSKPISFFTDALSNSVSLDLGLGFFSSASFNVLAFGFAKFISNGGYLRLYINQHLSETDFALLTDSKNTVFEESILKNFNELLSILSKRDQHFFDCLSYLIRHNRIEIKIIIPKSGGIAHQKFGIFTDEKQNKVAFNGSLNMTASALLSHNIETISCNMSWSGDTDFIEEYEKLFQKYFEGNDKDTLIFPANKLTAEIVKTFPHKEIGDLLKEEKEIVKELDSQERIYIWNHLAEKNDPRFPYSTGPRTYQIQAYEKWLEHEKSGIFAMATGTGKTITSLNCVLEEYIKNKSYRIVILVPTNDLVNQWIEEVQKFNFTNLYIVNGENNWRENLTILKNDFEWGLGKDFVIISTYASFTNEEFIDILNCLSDDSTILIADEAHNVGSEGVKKAFKNLQISKRIALSATPNRAYDEEGTKEIEKLFHDEPPYCYSFSMEKAIQEGHLMKYLYFPRLVYLEKEETDRYIILTKKLLRYFDSKTKKFKKDPEVDRLLMQRKRIIHKANDKYRAFGSIIQELYDENLYKYCFVYAPEGMEYRDAGSETKRVLTHLKKIVNDKFPQIKTNSYIGSDKNKKDKLRAFSEGEIDMLFAMKCLDEGVDVPRAEIGIFTSSTGNPRQFIQRRGRVLRKHKDKTFARIYDMIVVPNFNLYDKNDGTYEMERSMVRKELVRVGYFASLASNYIQATNELKDVLDYYNLEISTIIQEIKEQ